MFLSDYASTASVAFKSMSDRLAEDMANDYIFTVQISCTFPKWYYHASLTSMTSIPEHTLRSSYTFSSKMPREEIKEEIQKIEETLIKTYETGITKRYGIKYDRLLERKIEYELEVEKR
jgi:hypothetical protein